jgi:cellulose synthase/poly-beta-1,6-N-acetylglucosamine synthase-like glycosyltransferase
MNARHTIDKQSTLVLNQPRYDGRFGSSIDGSQRVSIVIPTLNESDNIEKLLLRLEAAMTKASISYEAIVIDDHSQDGTREIAINVAKANNLPVHVLSKQGQPGKAFSLIEGFAVAHYDILALIDGDLQYPPEAIPEMVDKLKDADIVIGDRRVTYSSTDRFRGAMSGIFTTIINFLFGLDTDVQSGLKVFRRSIYDEIEVEPGKWSLDLHLITHALYKGYSVANVPIMYAQRQAGESKVIPVAVAIELLMTAFALKITSTMLGIFAGNRASRAQRVARKYIVGADASIAEQVQHYERWLDADAQRGYTINSQKALEDYRSLALRTTEVDGKEIAIFAPFRQKFSALQTFTPGQLFVLALMLMLLIVGLALFPTQTLVAGIALVTLFYFGDLLVNFVLVARTLDMPTAEKIDDELVHTLDHANWPMYTVLCPLYREAAVVPQFVKAMQDLDYPTDRLQILFLTEQDDAETRDAIRAMNLPAHFTILTVPDGQPRTKPRACNYGLLYAKGRYIVIYDAEDCPDPLQLKKAVLTFANHGPDVACVQAKLNFYNPDQNLLTRWFTAEYSLWFDLTLPGLQRAGFSLPLGGTSNHFRTELLRTLGAWDAFNVTEDCDLGLRLAHYNLKTIVLDSTTYEEANSQVKNWIRQRSRWVKGYMQTYLVYMRNPWRYFSSKHWDEFLSLQLIVGGKTAVLFVNPLMWLLLLTYIALRPFVGEVYQTLFPMPVLYMGTACLIFGNFFYAYTHLFGCVNRGRYGLVKWTLLIPLYWMLNSVAGFMALSQLIFKPHYWEKTQHGLHLQHVKSTAIDTPPQTDEISKHNIAAINTVALTRPALNQKKAVWAEQTVSVPATEKAVWAEQTVSVPAAENANAGTRRKAPVVEETLLLPTSAAVSRAPLPTITESMKTVFTIAMPVIHRQKKARRRLLPEDPWLTATFVTACIASIVAMWYFFSQHQTLLYGDAYAHMMIARRLFDSATPGLAQLGGVWLPLPHLVMLPFIWNDTLWQTGLAGTIPSMICYVIACIYIFLSARCLTGDSRASFIGTLVFILNPNILYLQTTPLSELVLAATLSAAGYYFLLWVRNDDSSQFIKASAAIFLATLARYDGWFLFLALAVLIVVIGLMKGHRWTRIEGNALVFCSLGGLGIGLWFLWCGAIFGDPLYFQRGPYSAQSQQADLLRHGILFTYHNWSGSILVYLTTLMRTLGPGLFILVALGILVYIVRLRWRFSPESLVGLALLAPVVFYVYSLYSGQAALFMPGASPATSPYQLFNARYGAEIVAPAALFLAFLAHLVPKSKMTLRFLLQLGLIIVVVVQSVSVAMTGIISLQDGQFGTNCFASHPVEFFLAQHYNNGRILTDEYTSQDDALEPEAGIHFNNVIYEGSERLWLQALKEPAAFVDWIIVNPENPNDMVAKQVKQNPLFLSSFTLVVHEQDGLSLFHKKVGAALPNRPLPSYLLTEHSLCGHAPGSQSAALNQLQQHPVPINTFTAIQDKKSRMQ